MSDEGRDIRAYRPKCSDRLQELAHELRDEVRAAIESGDIDPYLGWAISSTVGVGGPLGAMVMRLEIKSEQQGTYADELDCPHGVDLREGCGECTADVYEHFAKMRELDR